MSRRLLRVPEGPAGLSGLTSVMKLLSCCLARNLLTFWWILLSFSSSSRSAQRQCRYELTHTHSVSFHSDRVGYVLISKLSSNMVKKVQTARYSQALKLDVELLHLQILPRLQLERHEDNNERLQEQKCHCDAICGVMPGNQCSRQH